MTDTTSFLPYQLALKLKRKNPKKYHQIVAQQTKSYVGRREYMPEFIYKYLFGKYFITRQKIYTGKQQSPIRNYNFKDLDPEKRCIVDTTGKIRDAVPSNMRKMLIKLFKLCEFCRYGDLFYSTNPSMVNFIALTYKKTQPIKIEYTFTKHNYTVIFELPSSKTLENTTCKALIHNESYILLIDNNNRIHMFTIYTIIKYSPDENNNILKECRMTHYDLCPDDSHSRSRPRVIDEFYANVNKFFDVKQPEYVTI